MSHDLDRACGLTLDRACGLTLDRALDRARGMAFDLAGDLDRARHLTHGLIHLAHELDQNPDFARDFPRTIERSVSFDLTGIVDAIDRDRNLARANIHALELGRELALALDRAMGHSPDASAIEHALKVEVELERTLIRLANDRASDPAFDYVSAVEGTRRLVEELFKALSQVAGVEAGDPALPTTRIAVWSRRLTGWAVQVLPPTHRAIYQEIFDSELHDLAADGCTRRAQVAHALRILVHTPRLRRDLLAPGPTALERSET